VAVIGGQFENNLLNNAGLPYLCLFYRMTDTHTCGFVHKALSVELKEIESTHEETDDLGFHHAMEYIQSVRMN
jgi:hypothetical protein